MPTLLGLNANKEVAINGTDHCITHFSTVSSDLLYLPLGETVESPHVTQTPLSAISEPDSSLRETPNPFSIKYVDLDGLFGNRALPLEGTIVVRSHFPWVLCQEGFWILELIKNGEFILVEPDKNPPAVQDQHARHIIEHAKPPLFKAVHAGPNRAPQTLCQAAPLLTAIRASDSFAVSVVYRNTSVRTSV